MRHKIVLVPFPFDDFSGTKVRPAVCLTDEIGHYQHIIIAFISSQLPAHPEDSDIIIYKKDSDFSVTGLKVDSVIKLHRIVTIPKNLIRKQLGELSPELAFIVSDKLKSLFKIT